MEPEFVYVIGGAIGLGGLFGWLAGRLGGSRAALVLCVLIAVAMVALLLMGQQAQGWDGIAYAAGAFLFAGPALGGAIIGGAFGAVGRRKNRAKKAARVQD